MGRVRFGLKNGYYAPATSTEDGVMTYETPVQIKGVKAISLSAKGGSTDEYADDGTWFHDDSNNGYDGDLEFEDTVSADEFLETVLGMTKDKNGAVIEKASDEHKEFAFLGQFTLAGGKENGKRFVMYRCLASRPNVEGESREESIKVKTNKVKITCMPRVNDNAVKASAVSTDSCYAAWFSKVYETDASVTEP
jgi:phi13 family phage major tail protein